MSKPIGNLTLKATPVGTDAVAIADSEDSDKTKKVLLSALSGGGGSEYYHELKNVSMTFNSGDFSTSFITADCDGLTAYEEGIYVLKATSTNTGYSGYGVRLNINSLGNKSCCLLMPSVLGVTDKPLPKYFFNSGGIYIFAYYNNEFNNIYSPLLGWKQRVTYITNTSYSMNLDGLSATHAVNIFTANLTSLTLDNSPIPNQGFEQEFHFTTDSTFTFTAAGLVGKWIGGTPTFSPNTKYVISIKNGLAVCGEVS